MVPMLLPVSGSSKETDTVRDESSSGLDSSTSSNDNEMPATKAIDQSSPVEPREIHPPTSSSNDTCHQGHEGSKQFENKCSPVPADDCCKETAPDKRKPLNYKPPRMYRIPTGVHKLSCLDSANLSGLISRGGHSKNPNENRMVKTNVTSSGKASSLPTLAGPGLEDTSIRLESGSSSGVLLTNKQRPPTRAPQGSLSSQSNLKDSYRYPDQGDRTPEQEPNSCASRNLPLINKERHSYAPQDTSSSGSNGNVIFSKEKHRYHSQGQGAPGQEPNPGSSSNFQLGNEPCRTYAQSNGNGVALKNNYGYHSQGQWGPWQDRNRGPSSSTPFTSREHSSDAPQGSSTYQSNGNGAVFQVKFRYPYQRQGGIGQEQTRGPRFSTLSNPSIRRANLEKVKHSIKCDKYNLPDFQTEYKDARFFIIKSFGEVDVHKAIKYRVWSSTKLGNNKLDAAFHEASEAKCPIFLFFSVNRSGLYLGVAEMVGRVDFIKKMQFWMDDLWDGFFPVQWHIIKDVPSKLFSHIILKNNDNKRVNRSRDTQEVGLEAGLEMLNIFKNYSEETSLLDDFCFYEERESSSRG